MYPKGFDAASYADMKRWEATVMPEVKALLEIPESHYAGVIIGFGYPEIAYARGTQRELSPARIHRISFEEEKNERTEMS